MARSFRTESSEGRLTTMHDGPRSHDKILARRVTAEEHAIGGGRSALDRILTPANRLSSRRFLREARNKMWLNVAELQRARLDDADAYHTRLAELEVLSVAKIADLRRLAQVGCDLAGEGNPGLTGLESDRLAGLVDEVNGCGGFRPFPPAFDLPPVPVDRHRTLAHGVGLYRWRPANITVPVWMVAHLHDHDIVGLGDRPAVTVGVSRSVPAHGVSA
jgi:hypothetical protein